MKYIIVKHAHPSVSKHYWNDDPTQGTVHPSYSVHDTFTGKECNIKPYYEDKGEAQRHCDALNEVNPVGAYAVCVMQE